MQQKYSKVKSIQNKTQINTKKKNYNTTHNKDEIIEHLKLDKFYTKESVSKILLQEIGNLNKYDLIIEPSAGSGAFSKNIKHKNLISIDIHPESQEILKFNWFDFQIDRSLKKVAVIGNPPFGKITNYQKTF